MRFINDDVKLKNGGRNAVKISEDDLWEKIVARARAIAEDIDEDEEDDGYDGENAYVFIRELLCCDPLIRKDIKFNVDSENILVPEDGDDHLGMQTLPNGFTFYSVEMGGDWEVPIFMIIYYDGKKLRVYIPSYGNLVNLDCKCAFGSEDNNIDDEKAKKLLKKYSKFGPIPDKDEFNFQTWSELYCRMYDETPDGAEYNYRAMLEDIQSRIVVS